MKICDYWVRGIYTDSSWIERSSYGDTVGSLMTVVGSALKLVIGKMVNEGSSETDESPIAVGSTGLEKTLVGTMELFSWLDFN